MNIAEFENKNAFQQTLFVDNFLNEVDIDTIPEAEVEVFLNSIYLNSTNNYIKRSFLIIWSDLILCEKINNPHALLGQLYKLIKEPTGDVFLQSIAIKYYCLIKETLSDEVLNNLKKLTDSESADIASEALFWLGIGELKKITDNNPLTLALHLNKAKSYFKASTNAIENREDATYYLLIVGFIEAIATKESDKAKIYFKDIEKVLLYRITYELEYKHLEFDFIIFQILRSINDNYQSLIVVDGWINFKEEFECLYTINNSINAIISNKGKHKKNIQLIFNSVLKNASKTLYGLTLSNEKQRIINLRNITDNQCIIEYLEYVIEQIPSLEIPNVENYQLLIALIKLLGEKEGLEKYNQIKNKSNIGEIITAFSSFAERNSNSIAEFITGSMIGQDIYYTLKNDIQNKLPGYSEAKLNTFFKIVEEVIRYARRCFVESSKKDYMFLYAESEGGLGSKAKEQDLQDSMYNMLKLTPIAYGFEHEKAKFTDGGRVDIVFKTDFVTFPIEIKKTEIEVTLDRIEEDYISQAQTYAAGYDQLGIFALLDLTDKELSPSINMKDWFNIHHIPPKTGLNIKYPDYIISVVIPGNRILPSKKSKYK